MDDEELRGAVQRVLPATDLGEIDSIKERAAYLSELAAQCVAPATLIKKARSCLRVAVELERWPTDHCFDNDEVREMASRYAAQCRAASSRNASEHFRATAVDLLRRHGRLRLEHTGLPHRYEAMLCEFIALQHERSWLSDATCQSARWQITKFLDYLEQRGLVLETIHPADVDAFYQRMALRWSRRSLSRTVSFLRAWLGHCERRSYARPGLARALLAPRIYRHEALPMGPTWHTVGRMLAATGGDDPTSIRDHAIILLLSVYGVRSGEVRRLRLNDIDWLGDRVRFIRSKSGRYEEAPLVARVTVEQIDATVARDFLAHLEPVRGNATSTRNLRLTALHSLFRFIAWQAPELVEHAATIHTSTVGEKRRR